jgi:hypothetical protein
LKEDNEVRMQYITIKIIKKSLDNVCDVPKCKASPLTQTLAQISIYPLFCQCESNHNDAYKISARKSEKRDHTEDLK